MEEQKICDPFDTGIKRGRNKEDKTVMEWFTIDYPNIDSDVANLYLPSYKEGFSIGIDEGEFEEDKCDPENHFKVWVNPDALRIEEEAESNKRYKDYLKTL